LASEVKRFSVLGSQERLSLQARVLQGFTEVSTGSPVLSESRQRREFNPQKGIQSGNLGRGVFRKLLRARKVYD